MKGEIGICGAEAGNEVILEGTNGAFGGIAAVHMGRNQLEVDVFSAHELFENVRGFVVKTLQDWTAASSNEDRKRLLVCIKDGSCALCFHGFCVDKVGVIVVEYKELRVTLAAWDGETAGLVGEDFASCLNAGSIAEVRAYTVGKRNGEKRILENVGLGWKRTGGAGRLLVLPGLVKMSFVHGNGDRGEFGKGGQGETWDVDEVVA